MDKKVLISCPQFYGYEKNIADGFSRHGWQCTTIFYNEKNLIKYKFFRFPIVLAVSLVSSLWGGHHQSAFVNNVKTWGKNFSAFQDFLNSKLDDLNEKFDMILVVKGFGYSEQNIAKLRTICAGKLVIYQWDPIDRFPGLLHLYKHFDLVFTFQKEDEKKYPSSIYLPTFHIPTEVRGEPSRGGANIVFVGEFTFARHVKLIRILRYCRKNNIYCDFHLISQLPFIRFLNLLRGLEISRNTLSNQFVQRLYSNSLAVVDLPKTGQAGITQRVYEALALGKKVITAAKDCEDWPFFSSGAIMPLELFTLNGSEFLSSKSSKHIDVSDWSVDKWVSNILSKCY